MKLKFVWVLVDIKILSLLGKKVTAFLERFVASKKDQRKRNGRGLGKCLNGLHEK